MWRVTIEQRFTYNQDVEFWFEDLLKATNLAQTLSNAVPTKGKTQISIIGDDMDFTEKEESNGED